jgi:hypothetical protein
LILFETVEFDDEGIRYQSVTVTNNLVLWQNGFMHRSEIPDIVVLPIAIGTRGHHIKIRNKE